MTLTPNLTSNNPTLDSAVAEWLHESRMELPEDFRVVLNVVDSVGEWDDSREIFQQADVDIRAGEPLGWVHVTWRAAPARARIDERRAEAIVEVSREALEQVDYFLRSFFLVTLIFLWKRVGRYHVHAATAIDPAGRGWMLIGDSCSGKSTTTALLASRGWRVSTDDIAFLAPGGDRARVVGFRSPIALRPGGFDLIGRAGGLALARRGKHGFWPEDLGAAWVSEVAPDIVVFTAIGGDRTTLTPLPARQAITPLMQRSPWVLFEPTGSQEHLDLMARLTRQARCYTATLAPDLFSAPGALGDFLP